MGVVNLSPESKYPATVAADASEALRIADGHRQDGASVIDVGAQSSHFDNVELGAAEELDRLAAPLERLVGDGHIVSVDTWKPEVARGAIELGAVIVNDTGGLQNRDMVEVVAASNVAAVVMYLEASSPLAVGPIDLSHSIVGTMAKDLGSRLEDLRARGITDIVVDPGIGIAYRADRSKYTEHQIDVLRRLRHLSELGHPVLIPVPRKPEVARTLALATLAFEYGADILRVHDVGAVAEIGRMMGRLE